MSAKNTLATFVSALLIFVVCLPASASAVANATSASDAVKLLSPGGYYIIRDEDVLRLDVWGVPELTGLQMQVTPDGKINVGFIGDVQAEGLTIEQLTNEIIKKFEAADILRNPKVQITLVTMHQPMVRVLGDVARPGTYHYKPKDTILDALALAGSYNDDSWLEKATITHTDDTLKKYPGMPKQQHINLRVMLDGNLSQNEELHNGDTIYIPPEDYQNKIYVMGEVNRPGMYPWKEHTTVLDAIQLANGPITRAAMSRTVVLRGAPGKAKKVQCNIARLINKGDLSQNIQLKPGDMVYVPETKRPDLNKISQLLGIIFNLTYIQRVGLF